MKLPSVNTSFSITGARDFSMVAGLLGGVSLSVLIVILIIWLVFWKKEKKKYEEEEAPNEIRYTSWSGAAACFVCS